MKHLKLRFVFFILLSLPFVQATRGREDFMFATVDEQLLRKYGGEAAGAYALASDNGTDIFSKGYGLANVEWNEEMSENTVFRIASLTKQFTAVAVLVLFEDGDIDLDDAISEHVKGLPLLWQKITVRQLLNHTSGLTSDMKPLLSNLTKDLTPHELVALYVDIAPDNPPGESWRYSNLNYYLLGLLIEKKSQMDYASFVLSKVLGPAYLSQTRYGNFTDVIPRRADGYTKNDKGVLKRARYFSWTLGYAAGGFLSTPAEMGRWYQALCSGKILHSETLRLIFEPAETLDGEVHGYGLGWYLEEIDGLHVAHHGGSTLGFLSYVYWQPGKCLFSGIFSNRDYDEAEPKKETRMLLQNMLHASQ